MAFLNVGSLLARYEKLFDLHTRDKELVCIVLKEEAGITVAPENVSVKNKTASINAGFALKNEIFLRKTKILERLKSANIYEIK